MRAIPRFPGATRDVSLLLAEDIPAARVVEVIEAVARAAASAASGCSRTIATPSSATGMKSMLWSIAYRSPERTLTDVEVDKAHEAIVGRLVENLPAQRR